MTPLHLQLSFTEWPPYTTDAIPGGGVLTRILSECAGVGGGGIEWTQLPWTEALARTRAGEFDAVFPGYSSPERAERFLLSAPLLGGELSLFALDGESPRPMEAEIRVAVTEGYVNCPSIDADPRIRPIVVADDHTGLERMLEGKVRGVALDHFVGRYHLRHSIPPHLRRLRVVERSLGRFGLHVLFSRARPDAEKKVAQLDALLQAGGAQHLLTDSLRGYDAPNDP